MGAPAAGPSPMPPGNIPRPPLAAATRAVSMPPEQLEMKSGSTPYRDVRQCRLNEMSGTVPGSESSLPVLGLSRLGNACPTT